MGIHFGVDYYPEHWPRERWETDAKLMQEMGVQVVRMAEYMADEHARFASGEACRYEVTLELLKRMA